MWQLVVVERPAALTLGLIISQDLALLGRNLRREIFQKVFDYYVIALELGSQAGFISGLEFLRDEAEVLSKSRFRILDPARSLLNTLYQALGRR